MIAIVDYDAGNICSVENALRRLGAEYELTADVQKLDAADKLILPGVGNDARAVASLREKGLVDVLRGRRKPVLGICVGMQIMCRRSEEGAAPGAWTECLDIFDCDIVRFPEGALRGQGAGEVDKVPHMGWNAISNLESKLFKGLDEGSYVYFVHSYYPTLCTDTIATCRHAGVLFSAALKYENFYGTQFHPEKSGDTGELILNNFLAL
ncbi:MAG: imidazole glycerol phosphate synthase subunit HisH [Bacteroidales bacterium]|nr:imidazole glycerol phosphate synthase subunit HisH [Bacteroidales bacterium]